MKNILLVCVLNILLVGCASTHPGFYGVAVEQGAKMPIKISAKPVDDREEDSFQLFEITIENTSDQWLRINNSRVVINDPADSKLSVVLGKDLYNWAEAMDNRYKLEAYNKVLAQTALLTAGSVALAAGSQSGSSDLANAGASAVSASYVWAVHDVFRSAKVSAEGIGRTPDNHLYESFSVPGKMFLRRWLLMNKPTSTLIRTLVLELETVEGARGKYVITF